MNNRQHNPAGRHNQEPVGTRVKKAKDRLPYGFIPVGNTKIKRETGTDLGEDAGELYTGYIDCTLFALNELCVGNKHVEIGSEKTEISPLQVNGRVLISAAALKGCVSSFLAAYLRLPISRMNEHRYSFRPNNAFGGSIPQAAGIVEAMESDGSAKIKKFTDNMFAFTDKKMADGEYSYEKKNNKYKISKYGSDSSWFRFYPYHDGLDGRGTLGSKVVPPINHKYLGVKVNGPDSGPAFDRVMYTISADKHSEYKQTLKTLADMNKGHLSDHPMSDKVNLQDVSRNIQEYGGIKEGDVVFFEYRNGDTKVLTFGKHFRYRWAYSRSLRDFSNDYLFYSSEDLQQNKLNIVEDMFGYSVDDKKIPVKYRSRAGKVHFSCAEHLPGTGSTVEEKWMPRPGSPKPSSYEFYIRQQEPPKAPLTTYGDPARNDYRNPPRLAGRKFFYKYPVNNPLAGKDTGTVKLRDVLIPSKDSFPTFKFKVHFENLTVKELNLLHFGLCLGQNKPPDIAKPLPEQDLLCHQLGYGKNHGMGAVKISIDLVGNEKREAVYRLKHNKDENKLEKFFLTVTHKLAISDENMKNLFTYQDDQREYPALNGEIYSWHTKLKNDDLKRRRN